MAITPKPLSRHRWWRRSMLAGFVCGVAAGCLLEWYFNWGPAAGGMDSGEAHGYWLMLIGFPATWLVFSVEGVPSPVLLRTLLVLAVGVSWGLLWTAVPMLWRGAERR